MQFQTQINHRNYKLSSVNNIHLHKVTYISSGGDVL